MKGVGSIYSGPLTLAVLAALLMPMAAFAQEAPALRAHHFTLGGAVVWSGGYDIGDSTAQLRIDGSRVPGRSACVSIRCASRAASWAGRRWSCLVCSAIYKSGPVWWFGVLTVL